MYLLNVINSRNSAMRNPHWPFAITENKILLWNTRKNYVNQLLCVAGLLSFTKNRLKLYFHHWNSFYLQTIERNRANFVNFRYPLDETNDPIACWYVHRITFGQEKPNTRILIYANFRMCTHATAAAGTTHSWINLLSLHLLRSFVWVCEIFFSPFNL